MKLSKILDQLNSFEKNSFLKIIDSIICDNPKLVEVIDRILSNDVTRDLKNLDNVNISKVFDLVKDEFKRYIYKEFVYTTSQLDILTDILTRDGNCVVKQDWFARLYENELKLIEKNLKAFKKSIKEEYISIDPDRIRDYSIYTECLKTAYENDDSRNEERKITLDEQSILHTLSEQLELSQDEIKLINYTIIPIQKQHIDSIINDLRNMGVIFYSRKNNTVYVAQEIVRILREIRGKDVADKHFRRVLNQIREPQINLICKKHNIDWKKPLAYKIDHIISNGISLKSILQNEIHKEGVLLTDKKKYLNELNEKGLEIPNPTKGQTIEEKIQNIIDHFNTIEEDELVSISLEGYERLLIDLQSFIGSAQKEILKRFELQEGNELQVDFLLQYNLKPRDILEALPEQLLLTFAEKMSIKQRGNLINNILETYLDTENIYLENYVNIGKRDLQLLKENGIPTSDAELGLKFEELTRLILTKLGFNVDEELKKKINTKQDKADILLNIGNNEVIIVECKSTKENGYNKFSAVKRQLKSYLDMAEKNGLKVIKSLLVAPDFSDDFITECELEYELNLSLVKASTLYNILEGFKDSKKEALPYKLLLRDVMINEERIVKAIT